MSYRAFKRLLGETSLERKCRFLFGAFILVAPNSPLSGEVSGARLLDIAPTLLELAGHEIPCSMQGRSLASEKHDQVPSVDQDHRDAERIVRERLSGLGYI